MILELRCGSCGEPLILKDIDERETEGDGILWIRPCLRCCRNERAHGRKYGILEGRELASIRPEKMELSAEEIKRAVDLRKVEKSTGGSRFCQVCGYEEVDNWFCPMCEAKRIREGGRKGA